MSAVAEAWDCHRSELLRFVRRLVIQPEIAEDIVQKTAVRAIEAETVPDDGLGLRKWLFRIASNLAIDELRRQGRWSEAALFDSRRHAEQDESFVAASVAMRATPEVAAMARQHLAFCFSCTLRSIAPQKAAALLLTDLYGFALKETAEILSASFAQTKNWLQEARADLHRRYADTCALITKNGVCYQCTELSGFFNGKAENPLADRAGRLAERLEIVREADHRDLSTWHRLLLEIIETRRAGKSTVKRT